MCLTFLVQSKLQHKKHYHKKFIYIYILLYDYICDCKNRNNEMKLDSEGIFKIVDNNLF